MLKSQEHYDVIRQFENDMKSAPGAPRIRIEKEARDMWHTGHVYQDGVTNQLFVTYRIGYAFGKAVARHESTAA